MKNPCIDCIVLASCKARASKSDFLFIAWAGANCELYANFVMPRRRNHVDVERANELGKLFGYEIKDKKVYHHGESLQKMSASE